MDTLNSYVKWLLQAIPCRKVKEKTTYVSRGYPQGYPLVYVVLEELESNLYGRLALQVLSNLDKPP